MKHWWRRSAYTVSAWALLLFLLLLLPFSTLPWFHWVNSCLRACRIIIIIIIDDGSRRLAIILVHLFNCCYFFHLPPSYFHCAIVCRIQIQFFFSIQWFFRTCIQYYTMRTEQLKVVRKSLCYSDAGAVDFISHRNFSSHLPPPAPWINFIFVAFWFNQVGCIRISYSMWIVNAWIQSFCFAFCNDWANLIRAWIGLIMMFNSNVISLCFLYFLYIVLVLPSTIYNSTFICLRKKTTTIFLFFCSISHRVRLDLKVFVPCVPEHDYMI